MSTHTAAICWERDASPFTDNRYSRAHEWRFDGGLVVPGSPDPNVIKPPMSRIDAVDPEEALVASVSACHMLFFLALAAKHGFVVDAYTDQPEGRMTRNEHNKLYISAITLNPNLTFSGTKQPTPHDIERLHHRAHAECYIANSIRADVTVADRPVRFV